MVKMKGIIFILLIIFFLLFSFYPTIFEISKSKKLADPNREFVLEHNYYWPDFNLYLSKIRQGYEGRLTALERYTSEKHTGSLIQEFYVVLGQLGRVLGLDPNNSYQLGRLVLSPLLLLVIILFIRHYFKSFTWQIMAFLITVSSGSFPKIREDSSGTIQITRYMDWWSNIDALQRLTFIPHILFGQVASFYLLYHLAMKQFNNITMKQLIFYIFLGNLVGLTFPPSLITLDGVLILMVLMSSRVPIKSGRGDLYRLFLRHPADRNDRKFGLFVILTLPSLLYIFLITKQLPWSTLVDFHRTHPMMIPFDQYILGTGPIFFLGIAGAIISIIKRDKIWQPLIFWILATFSFAAFFSIIKDQSPLRFTQTGLFIPLGILGAYFFYQFFHISNLSNLDRDVVKAAFIIILSLYIFGNLLIMKTSLDWQTTWLTQKIGANIPPVPYPPQAMYPLSEWMDGIRWLRDNTNHDDVFLAEITAGNHIPAYAGNTVYFGQSNTVDYDRKQLEVDKFFKGKMSQNEAQIFLKNGRIKYIFFSVQEKEKAGEKSLVDFYPFVKSIYTNHILTIYNLN